MGVEARATGFLNWKLFGDVGWSWTLCGIYDASREQIVNPEDSPVP